MDKDKAQKQQAANETAYYTMDLATQDEMKQKYKAESTKINQQKNFRELSLLQLFSIIVSVLCPLPFIGVSANAGFVALGGALGIVTLGLLICMIAKKTIASSKRETWLPLRCLIYKEIIVFFEIIFAYIQSNNMADGYEKASIGYGLIMMTGLTGLVFNSIAFIKSAKKLWQIEAIYFTMLLNFYICLFLSCFFH